MGKLTADEEKQNACDLLAKSVEPYKLSVALKPIPWSGDSFMQSHFEVSATTDGGVSLDGPELKRALMIAFEAAGFKNSHGFAKGNRVWMEGRTLESVAQGLVVRPTETTEMCSEFGSVFKAAIKGQTIDKLDRLVEDTEEKLNGRLLLRPTEGFENPTDDGVETIGQGYIVSKLKDVPPNRKGLVSSVDLERAVWNVCEVLNPDVDDLVSEVKRTKDGLWVSANLIDHLLQQPEALREALVNEFAQSKGKSR